MRASPASGANCSSTATPRHPSVKQTPSRRAREKRAAAKATTTPLRATSAARQLALVEDGRDSSRDRLKVRFSKPRTPPLSSRSSAATQGQSPIPSAPLFVKTLARRTRLASWFHSGRKKIDYLHDFGDGWHHDVNLLRVVEDDERHKRKLLG
ncbi:MAG: plasmid pRiA4b ORF-3 family protein, partial [Deltaproteobacteria bacterium]|nr:plasmid pRiA4b ORF-3 family protein [Deltaproteobacteria bacterium]